MIIKSAEFIKSAVTPEQYPDTNLPEVCFVGRSNVGKSSLINSILQRKKLVKTSSTPGKTRLINFFLINEIFVFVDLPGFGYSKVAKSIKKGWDKMMEDYFKKRDNLKGAIFLIDIRRTKLSKEEEELIYWFKYFQIKTFFVLTKADKLSNNQKVKQIGVISKILNLRKDEILTSSSKKNIGRKELWDKINLLIGKESI